MLRSGERDISKPQLTVTVSMTLYDFVRWAQKGEKFRVTRSAVVEAALIMLADHMGYPYDKIELKRGLDRLEGTVGRSADVI